MAGCAPTDWTATDCAPANRATGAANSVLEREPHLYIHLAIVSRAATSTPRSEPAGQTPVLSEERRAQIAARRTPVDVIDRKSTRLNSSHLGISYAVFCLKKKRKSE